MKNVIPTIFPPQLVVSLVKLDQISTNKIHYDSKKLRFLIKQINQNEDVELTSEDIAEDGVHYSHIGKYMTDQDLATQEFPCWHCGEKIDDTSCVYRFCANAHMYHHDCINDIHTVCYLAEYAVAPALNSGC